MSDIEEEKVTISEVLVALDSSHHSRAALETAALVAKLMKAELRGIFVREIEWMKISQLPSVDEINEVTGEISPIAKDSVLKQIQTLEKEIKEHFELISKRNKIRSSWESVEGVVNEKVLKAAKTADLITIGSKGRSYTKRNKLGKTAKAVIRQAGKPVLILQEGFKIGGVVIAVYDGSGKSSKSVKLAASLAEKNESQLKILDLTNDDSSSDRVVIDLKRLTDHADIKAEQMVVKYPNIGSLIYLLGNLGCGLVVVPKSRRYIKTQTLELILQSVNCPVLLME